MPAKIVFRLKHLFLSSPPPLFRLYLADGRESTEPSSAGLGNSAVQCLGRRVFYRHEPQNESPRQHTGHRLAGT